MKPGPPPQPPELRLIKGNPGHRPIRNRRLTPSMGASRPAMLTPAAATEWRRLLPQLMRLGLLTRIDRGALASYCEAWADFVRATELVEKEGHVTLAGNGTQIPHPAIAIKYKAMELIRRFANEFGFTPAARARPLDAPEPEDPTDDSARFFGPRAAPPPAPPSRTPRQRRR